MKYLMKRLTAAFLCLALLLSLMVGCNQTQDTSSVVSGETDTSDIVSDEAGGEDITSDEATSEEDTASTEETASNSTTGTPSKNNTATTSSKKNQSAANTNKVNLKGKEILVKTVHNNAFGARVEPVDPEDESAEQKVLREWRENFEKTYNCKIKVQQIAANDTQNQIIVKMLSGDKFADVIVAQRLDFERIRMAGDLLVDLNQIKSIDWDNGGYMKGLNQMYNYGGKQLALNYSMSAIVQSGFLVNNDLLKKLKAEDPYKLAKEGKWTFDKFFALAKKATVDNGNGTWDLQDQYGLFWQGIATSALFKSAGVNVFTQDANGKMKYTMNSAKFRTVADLFITNVVKTNVGIPAPTITIALKQFCAGKVLMLALPSYYSGTILATADINLGWLPFPTEKGGKNYVNLVDGWSGAYMIPAANKDLEAAGLLLSEYVKIHDDYQKAVREDYTNNTFVNCSECWDLFENGLVNWTGDYYFPEMGQQIPWNIMHKVATGDSDYINNLESFDAEIQAWVDDVYNK